jgi:hypothetical protein
LSPRIGFRPGKGVGASADRARREDTCDNPECAVYVEELVREEPNRYELVDYVREQLAARGWKRQGFRGSVQTSFQMRGFRLR